jgi:hypothetical protein
MLGRLARTHAPVWPAAATIAVGLGLGLGIAVVQRPVAVGATSLAVCVALFLTRWFRALPRLFLGVLGVLLVGYALFGRSFAYLGAPPIFVGEMALAFGLVAALASGGVLTVARSPITHAILAFAICGAIATVPYVGTYKFDALRDATLWAYAAFSICVAACVITTGAMADLVRHYSKWTIRFAVWLPIVTLAGRFLGAQLPMMPGTELPIFSVKPNDAGVHLAGVAVFLLLRLDGAPGGERHDRPRLWRYTFWSAWLLSTLTIAALTRGGFLAIVAALVVASICEPALIGRRLLAFGAIGTVAGGITLLGAINWKDTSAVAAASEERALSPRQVVENILSITGRESEMRGNLSSTREWRLDWWKTITDYTVHGPYFWKGKGFGVNLADDDGFQVAQEDEAPLRSPHSVHMTVLARMGVPGTVLWALLQLCFGGTIFLAQWAARRRGALWSARVMVWILSYWAAFLVSASFDVVLEGPYAGIWFWCVVGVGIAAVIMERDAAAGAPVGSAA